MSVSLLSPSMAYNNLQNKNPYQQESSYLLPSNQEEKDRLTLQHNILKHVFGWLIHPLIPIGPGQRILDSCTGTGIWSLELAKQIPSDAVIEGIDITPSLFPTTIPRNVNFSVKSIFALPLEWAKKFDVVHQRLLVAAFTESEWRRALAELYRVLKPGGWVELIEVDPRIYLELSGPAHEKVYAIHKALVESQGLLWDCVDRIPRFAEETGFIKPSLERASPPIGRWAGARGGEDMMRNYIIFFEALTPKLLGAGLIRSKEEWERLLRELEDEWNTMSQEKGKKCLYRWTAYVARKPTHESKL